MAIYTAACITWQCRTVWALSVEMTFDIDARMHIRQHPAKYFKPILIFNLKNENVDIIFIRQI